MTDWSFQPIAHKDIDSDDRKYIAQALHAAHEGFTVDQVVLSVERDYASLWRYVSGEHRGIAVTQVIDKGGEGYRELFVWLVSGNGVIPYLEKFVEALVEFAKVCGCKKVTSNSNPAMARMMVSRCGFKVAWYAMEKEVNG